MPSLDCCSKGAVQTNGLLIQKTPGTARGRVFRLALLASHHPAGATLSTGAQLPMVVD